MYKFDIFCDSGANIPDELIKKYDIKVIPYTINCDGKEIICASDGTPYAETAKRFYQKMREGAEISTSLVNTASFVENIKPTLEAGKDAILTLISAGISGTYNQAKEAQKLLSEMYPERKVLVFDSVNASMGEGLQVLQAARLRELGQSIESCAEWIEDNAYKINSYLTVGDLKFLKKSGRISTTLAIAGTILNIKPVLRADGGSPAKIVFFDKARGRKKALAALAEAFEQNAIDPASHPVAICHADSEEDANELAEMVKAKGATEVIMEYYDMCTGSHVGPGTVALFFYGKDRREGKTEKGKLFKRTAKQTT